MPTNVNERSKTMGPLLAEAPFVRQDARLACIRNLSHNVRFGCGRRSLALPWCQLP